jgi:hypothetical protein
MSVYHYFKSLKLDVAIPDVPFEATHSVKCEHTISLKSHTGQVIALSIQLQATWM